jgi:hypothetical protein
MVKLSDVLRIEKPDVLSSRYGKAFEKAVLTLIKTRDIAQAMSDFIRHYGEPHTGAFAKLMKLKSWAMTVYNAESVKFVEMWIDGIRFTVQADFVVQYFNGKKELVELKSHILKNEEWQIKGEWALAAKIMRMAYRRAGFDYPLRLIFFVEKDGAVQMEEEVFIYPKDEKDDMALINVIRERLKRI